MDAASAAVLLANGGTRSLVCDATSAPPFPRHGALCPPRERRDAVHRGRTRRLRRLVRLHASFLRGETAASASLVPSLILAPWPARPPSQTPWSPPIVVTRTQRPPRAPRDAHAAAAPDTATVLAAERAPPQCWRLWRRVSGLCVGGGAQETCQRRALSPSSTSSRFLLNTYEFTAR